MDELVSGEVGGGLDSKGTYGYGLAHLRLDLLRDVLLDEKLDRHPIDILEDRLGRLHTSVYHIARQS